MSFWSILFMLAPLVGQGIQSVQQAMGVNHPTIAGQVAGWLIGLTLAGRAVVSAQNKNVSAGSDTAGGGA